MVVLGGVTVLAAGFGFRGELKLRIRALVSVRREFGVCKGRESEQK